MNKSVFIMLLLISASAGLSASDFFNYFPGCAGEQVEFEWREKKTREVCASFYQCYYAGKELIYLKNGSVLMPLGNMDCVATKCDEFIRASDIAREKLRLCKAMLS